MSKSLLDQVTKHRREIKSDFLTYGLSELVSMHRAGDIQIRPEYQRLFRWDLDQQSHYIESLLLEIPIPPLFFYENADGKWELLDGLQRLSTAIKFLGGDEDVPSDHRDPDDEWHTEFQNDIGRPLQLTATEYLTMLEGFSFFRLPTSLQLNLKRVRMQIYVLKRETDPSYKYEVFQRLNTTGARLADQEVRNCSARMFGDKFPDFLQSLAKDINFTTALALDEEEIRAARAEELALRFLTMKNHSKSFKHDVAELLNNYMKGASDGSIEFDYTKEKLEFEATWKLAAKIADEGRMFRPKKGGALSPTVFEIVSLAIAHNLDAAAAMPETELKTRIEQLVVDAKAEGLTGAGSNSKKKTLGRVNRATGAFA